MSSRAAQALLLIAAATAWGFLGNLLRATPLPFRGDLGPPPVAETGADLPGAAPDAALALFEAGGFFVDARAREDFDARRVAGAISLPAAESATAYFAGVAGLAPELPLIVYGAGPDSFEVRRVGAELVQLGHLHVEVVVAGLDALLGAGAPAAEGPEATP